MAENDLENPNEKENQDPNENENFETLFESYMTDMSPDIRVGDKISGEIIVIGQDNVFLNTGSKIDGVVEKSELVDENGELPYKVGDRLDLYVVSIGDGEIQLSKAIGASGSAELLYEALQNKIPVEGKVTETCKSGFRVQVMGKTGFCPISQMDVVYVEKPETYVGATLEFLIDRIEEKGRNIVVNRRRHLERLLAEEREKFLEQVNAGDVINGRVSKIMPYGAFVELNPGVEGMVHISELSWSRLDDPAEVVSTGDSIPVKILSIEQADAKAGGIKISLSAKQVTGDPWATVTERFHPGDKVQGRVTRCADFGAFVEVEPGVEGLVHISEMSHIKRVMKAEELVSPGDQISVMIKTIDPAKKRMSLSIKDIEGDPWIDIENRLKVGQTVEGRIEKKADFGYFIYLEPGITGLLPKSRIERAPYPQEVEKLKTDDAITVKIEAIDTQDKKITLAVSDAVDQKDLQKYSSAAQSKTPSTGMGSLGEKLQEAMKSKK
ncbi:MAG: 30S ribosomal protein S1 [Desulfobacterales bacterium]|nr:30S ribosomal protein S1 [Desulfobacterales bacterium]